MHVYSHHIPAIP